MNEFEPKRSTARYCSTTCRSRAARSKTASADEAAEESKSDTPAEHGLVKAVRLELELHDVVLTIPGQLALQMARRIVDPEAAGLSTMSKELRALVAEATGAKPASTGSTDEPSESEDEDDEVTRARTRRAEARQEAGLA